MQLSQGRAALAQRIPPPIAYSPLAVRRKDCAGEGARHSRRDQGQFGCRVSAWIASNLGTERRKGRRKTANASKPPGSTPPRSTAPKIAKSDALSHIFGYTCFNDGSIRDIQFKHSIAAGKNFHATGGFGPWILTADEVPDPTRLRLATRLNGKEVQHTGIDDLIFDIPTLISYCSDWTPLIAGDVISTGTPEGVGFARKPPLWMKPGDVVEVEIDGGIGVLRNPIIAES